MTDRELVTVAVARDRLGVSKATMARLIREWDLTVYVNPLDRREKLLDWQEIEAAKAPRREDKDTGGAE